MIEFAKLLGVTIATWVLHVILVTTYTKLFSDTHGLLFRFVYAVELSATFSLVTAIFLRIVTAAPSLWVVLATTLGFLSIVDTVLSLTVRSVHQTFDVFHFIAAYSLLAICLTVVYKLAMRA